LTMDGPAPLGEHLRAGTRSNSAVVRCSLSHTTHWTTYSDAHLDVSQQ